MQIILIGKILRLKYSKNYIQRRSHRTSFKRDSLGSEKISKPFYFLVDNEVYTDDIADWFTCFVDDKAGTLAIREILYTFG